MINNILAIFRKELLGYFNSPLAYGITTIFWLLSGFFYVSSLLGPGGVIQSVSLQEQQGLTLPPIDVAYEFLKFYFSLLGSLILFLLPVLSMGLYSEERKRGTLELLATSPITNWAVAVGKLLGVVSYFVFMITPMIVYEIITFSASNPPFPFGVPLLAHVGLILLASAVLSLGMFISSLTDSAVFSAIFTFALILFLWVIDILAGNIGGVLGNILGHLSLLKHYNQLITGILDISSITVFISYIILGIFLTAQSIETLRFQRN